MADLTGTELILLTTGVEVPACTVGVTMITLKALFEADMIAVYEAREIARNPAHHPFGDTGNVLLSAKLIEESGRMHDVTRSIILAAVTGEDLNMELVSPLPEEVSTR